MKKKKLVTIIGIILIVIITLVIFVIIGTQGFNKKSKNNNSKTKMIKECKIIKEYKESKEKFVIYIKPVNSKSDHKVITNLYKDYPNIKTVKVYKSNIKNKCLKDEFERIGLYEDVEQSNGMIIGYKDGEYVVGISDFEEYMYIEDTLSQYGILKKKEIKETIDLDKFKNNIKKEYFLIIISSEKHRNTIDKSVKKYLDMDIDYDIVNMYSQKGSKIFDYVRETFKPGDGYPQIMYFKDSKLIEHAEVFNDGYEYNEFKKSIKK